MAVEPGAGRSLLRRLADKKAALLGEATIAPRPPGPAPLSFAQQRLWFIEQLEPGNPRFNILTAVRLRGRMQRSIIERVLNEIVRRHESLRTRFISLDGEPAQVVSPWLRVEIPGIDLSGLAAGRQEALLHRLVREEAAEPFDFARGPLLRARLLRLAPDHHVLFLTIHQIVIDRWSRGILVREVVTLYGAFVAGGPSPLPELPVQYADFAVWQRGYLSGELLARLLGYWRERLAPPLPVLELPADRPRPAVQGHQGRMQYDVIPQAELAALQALARREDATLFMVLCAALAALLHRYGGQEDLILGTPVANRHRNEIQDLIGFFLNMLPLRLRPRGGMPFRELLAEAREIALAAFAHQELPFERLVEDLELERDLSRHPLFQVTLVLQNAPIPPLELPGLAASLVEVDWGATAFDLALFFWETAMWESLEPGLSVTTSFSTALFDAATIRRLVTHLQRLLRQAAEHPEQALADLEILSTAERQQLLVEWNEPSAGNPPAGDLAQLFSAQAARTPDAVALDFPDGRLTWRELDRRACGVARRLRALGVGPEVPVGVLAERSWRTAAGFLAALLAGGYYLPVSPEDPEERREAILSDAGATVLLTAEDWGEEHGGTGAGEEESARAVWRAAGGSTACVLYTSGSAGAPKGVRVTHRAIARLALANGFLALAAGDRVAQASNPVFDAASFEIWGSLLTGAALVGLDKAALLAPGELAAALRSQQVTTLFLPTALFHRLVGGDPATFAGLRDLLVGGEPVEPESVRQVLRHGPPVRLFHVYGPTEATTFSSWELIRNVPAGAARLPAGRPVAGDRILIRDAFAGGRLVPAGAPGEVCLGGEGLALGYAGQPDQTAERFVPDPVSVVPGARLFRTGDLGRQLADGRLVLHGRRDRQLKVRGYRVEPGEIEAALATHPALREAVVVPWERAPEDRSLAAYVVLRKPVADAELRSYLQRRLPAYMIPALFVALAALPLMPRGKVDLRALPQPAPPGLPAPERRPVAPRTDAERRLAAIWADVLGCEVGVEDDIFALGGHSLQVTRIVSQLRAKGVEIPVRVFFERRTVAALAAWMELREPLGS
jgi:amino acid adenylation domain-containing protein